MEIAVLAWGSLVWKPANDFGELSVRPGSTWGADGPRLPVEFARISSDGRLTLVVVPGYEHETRVLWRHSGLDDVDAAVDNLAQRETNAPRAAIHAVTAAGDRLGQADPAVADRVERWVLRQDGVDAAVWTGLGPGPRWRDHGYDGFSPEHALAYARSLKGKTRRDTIEYVRNAPPQIDTPVRRALTAALDL